MATIRDVQFSQQGETQGAAATRKGRDISGMVTFDPKNPPTRENEWVVFKLVTNTNKGGVYLPHIDDVINPATGQIERVRLLTGVNSIWLKDQKDVTKEYADRNAREIAFPRGVKIRRVKSIDKTMIEYLRICNANVGNVNRIAGARFEIYEYDFAAAERDAFEREDFELEMAMAAKAEPLASMKKHAAFLGIRLITEFGEQKSEDGIRKEYVRYAKSNPDYFKKTLKSEQIEISYLVRTAISDSLIEIGREPGKIYWSNGGGMIGAYPQGDNPIDYLTNLALTNNEEGRLFKEQLKKVGT